MVDYGSDMSCVSDLETTMGIVTGRTVVVQAIARRLQTPRGRLIGDPDYGFDLAGYLNDDLSQSDIAWVQSQIDGECEKDERVLSATSEVSFLNDVMTVTIGIVLSDNETFDLVLSVSSVTVQILSVE